MNYSHQINVHKFPGIKRNGKLLRYQVAHSWTQTGTNGQRYLESGYYATKLEAEAAAKKLRETYSNS